MVDSKCNFSYGRYKKYESRTFSSDGLNEDESLLRQPLRSSYAGFTEAKKAYENGTDEVRQLLTKECSLIYECNVCRNMFRSLVNFISHKRNYCQNTSDNINSFSDRSSSVLIQTVERSVPSLVKSRSTGSSPIPNNKSSNRDLSKVIERLKRVEVSSNCSFNKTLGGMHNMKITSPEPKAPDPVLELERVPATTNAVYQTWKTKKTDSIRTELDEVHHLLSNQKVFLGPDGKAVHSPSLTSFASSSANEDVGLRQNNYKATQLLPGISCQICKIQFQTEKTLKMHVQRNHTSTTYVFQCPTCSMTFLQPAAVIRHLANEHKKPLRRIRKMRDTILKKRIQIGDVQVKGLEREVKRLQMINSKNLDGSLKTDEQNGRPIMSCTYCLKNFERRAALATHLTNCLVRKKSLKNAELIKRLSASSEQCNEAKALKQLSNNFPERIENNEMIKGEGAVDNVNFKQESKDDIDSNATNANIDKLFENLENETFGNGLHTVRLEKIHMLVELKERNDEKPEKINKAEKGTDCCHDQSTENNLNENGVVDAYIPIKKDKTKRFRIVSATKQLTCRCKICNKQFNALSNLRRHISMFHYRSRRFGCSLCDYRAFRRYDIVNHLTFVHKMTGERESMAVEYVTVHEIKYSKDDVDGDIVVINEEAAVSEEKNSVEQHVAKEPQSLASDNAIKTYENKEKCRKLKLHMNKDIEEKLKIENTIVSKDKTHVKVVRRKFKKSLEQVEGKKRPIRNRIKAVNNDFVYDLLPIKEEPKQASRLAFKRHNTVFFDENNLTNIEFAPPPIKIMPYRLRTEPLLPADKISIKGFATNLCRRLIQEGLAAPSTLPDLPAERPQMRHRLISSSRSDLNSVTIIETTELEAAGLKSTFFDDSFLEKFAKKSNPSFKMKPLLALQHSPLNSILQKFDASQQNHVNKTENQNFQNLPEKGVSSPPNYTICLLQSLTQPTLKEKDITPKNKQISDQSSPPATPKKRITLMQRLAENRAKTRDSLICTALEN